MSCSCKATGVEGVVAVNAMCEEHVGRVVTGPWGRVLGKNPVHESVTRLTIRSPREKFLDEAMWKKAAFFEVRVWRTEGEAFGFGDSADLERMAVELEKTLDGRMKANGGYIASVLGAMERVSAVEVVEGHTRQGIVFYPDWS